MLHKVSEECVALRGRRRWGGNEARGQGMGGGSQAESGGGEEKEYLGVLSESTLPRLAGDHTEAA